MFRTAVLGLYWVSTEARHLYNLSDAPEMECVDDLG